jgi:hypothetical protein
MAPRDPIPVLAWACIVIGLAIVVLGSAYVIFENRSIATAPRTSWMRPEFDDRLPVWPFFYSGTSVVAYGVLLLALRKPEE